MAGNCRVGASRRKGNASVGPRAHKRARRPQSRSPACAHRFPWDPQDVSHYLELAGANRRVSFRLPNRRGDVGGAAVRTDHPIPLACSFYYFEVTIVSAGRHGYIGIGLCTSGVNLNRLPGWDKNSFGYHGDDGNRFRETGTGTPYGPTFTTGDTIGCYYNMVDRTVSYTKNGEMLGVAFENVRGQLYPTVGLRSIGEIVRGNFGHAPFHFDIARQIELDTNKVATEIRSHALPSDKSHLSLLVFHYLTHHGHVETANALLEAAPGTVSESDAAVEDMRSVAVRIRIRQAILEAGDVPEAMRLICEIDPKILETEDLLVLQLRCQEYVEIARSGDMMRLLEYGQQFLSEPRGSLTPAVFRAHVEPVVAVLAYKDPLNSPVAALFDRTRREKLAMAVNTAILTRIGRPPRPALETFVRHAKVTLEQLASHGHPVAKVGTDVLHTILTDKRPDSADRIPSPRPHGPFSFARDESGLAAPEDDEEM